jgi:hypothetical protein
VAAATRVSLGATRRGISAAKPRFYREVVGRARPPGDRK